MAEPSGQKRDERPSWTGRAILAGIGFFVVACLVSWVRLEYYSQAVGIVGAALYTLLLWFSAGSFVLAICGVGRPRLALGPRSLRAPVIVGATCLVAGFVVQSAAAQLIAHRGGIRVTVFSEVFTNFVVLIQEFGIVCLAASLVVACIRSRDR
ncbi:hypothetical protein [Cutibacterium sp. V947]|uniref:hypothetical protein n=1 Tax=unclassified Cutibacterium TaxID=2649671 RepID=UPI003EDF5592